MNRQEREQARRMSDYVDGLVVQHRAAGDVPEPDGAENREMRELMALANELSAIQVPVPDGFAERLERRLPAHRDDAAPDAPGVVAGLAAAVRRAVAPWTHWTVAPRLVHAGLALAAGSALVALLVGAFASPSAVSAAEILYRADEALASLVGPGETLYRRWRVVSRTTEAPGTVETIQEYVVQEWLDGSDFDHVASRTNSLDGELVTAFANARESGDLRSRLYFAPGFSNEPAGLLNIEPTTRELHKALSLLPAEERPAIRAYIDLGYIYEPIRGEQRFNRAMLESAASSVSGLQIPRVVLSVDRSAEVRGVPVFKVRVVHPARIRARWRSEGPPIVRTLREETVRYVQRDSYLGVKSETLSEYEDGRRVQSTRDLVETRVIKTPADALEPFHLDVPQHIPVRRQSAFDHLSEVARKLRQSRTTRGLPEGSGRAATSR